MYFPAIRLGLTGLLLPENTIREFGRRENLRNFEGTKKEKLRSRIELLLFHCLALQPLKNPVLRVKIAISQLPLEEQIYMSILKTKEKHLFTPSCCSSWLCRPSWSRDSVHCWISCSGLGPRSVYTYSITQFHLSFTTANKRSSSEGGSIFLLCRRIIPPSLGWETASWHCWCNRKTLPNSRNHYNEQQGRKRPRLVLQWSMIGILVIRFKVS